MNESLDVLKYITNPENIIQAGGVWLLLAIIFAETGLFIGFLFPGDSLIFIAGVVCASRPELLNLNIYKLEALMISSAIVGNIFAYWFGARVGESLLTKEDSFFFKKSHINTTQIFYDKYGGFALIIGRFLPVVRSFSPIIAGMVKMNKSLFMLYNVLGAFLWIGLLTTLGYLLGNIPWVQNNLGLIVIGLVTITMIPLVIAYFKNKKK